MEYIDFAKMAGAFAIPLVAVAALFYQMMLHSLKPLRDDLNALRGDLNAVRQDVHSLRQDVHSIDVRLARVEEAVKTRA